MPRLPLSNRRGRDDSPIRRILKTIAIVAAFAAAFPISAWGMLGAGEAARAATELAMPVGFAWLLLFAGGVWSSLSHQRRKAAVFLFLWGLTGGLFSEPASGWMMRATEASPQPSATERTTPFDVVIVLGGGAGLDPLDRPELSGEGQRIMSAAQFWHAGKTRAIITTGASALSPTGPARVGAELLKSVGVPPAVIFEVPGQNTAQEMQRLQAFFDDPPPALLQIVGVPNDDSAERSGQPTPSKPTFRQAEVGLITSAFHMPRAQRLAAARKLDFTPLPCSYRTSTSKKSFTPRHLIPDIGAVDNVTLALKERIAWLVGR